MVMSTPSVPPRMAFSALLTTPPLLTAPADRGGGVMADTSGSLASTRIHWPDGAPATPPTLRLPPAP
jgi:hypothetical protein